MVMRAGWVCIVLVQALVFAAGTTPPNAQLPKPQFVPTPPNVPGPGPQVSPTPPAAPFPAPEFMGTPMDMPASAPHNPRKQQRVNPALPPGTINVAFRKPVTASDTKPSVGTLSQINGGKAGKAGYVELAPGKQYFQIDLQDTYRISSIVVWHYFMRPRVYRDVVVQLADDPAFTANVRTVFNNDDDNSLGLGVGADPQYIETREGRTLDAHGAAARYVRLYSNGNTENDRNHLTAVEVYGAK